MLAWVVINYEGAVRNDMKRSVLLLITSIDVIIQYDKSLTAILR